MAARTQYKGIRKQEKETGENGEAQQRVRSRERFRAVKTKNKRRRKKKIRLFPSDASKIEGRISLFCLLFLFHYPLTSIM